MLISLVAVAARATCAGPADRDDLASAVALAESAWDSLDAAALHAAVDSARALLPCLGEALTPSDVAAFWLALAYDAYTRSDVEGALSALRAARRLEPTQGPAVGRAHPLADLWDTPAGDPLGTVSVSTPVGGRVAIDGMDTDQAPVDREYVLQRFDSDDRLLVTLLHPPGGDLVPPPPTTPIDLDLSPPLQRGHPVRWVVAGLLVEALAVGLAGYAESLSAEIRTAPNQDALDRAFERQQVSAYTAYGLFGGGAILGTVGLAVALGWRDHASDAPAESTADP